jgi:cytochrome c-type biogenesis protein CcmF
MVSILGQTLVLAALLCASAGTVTGFIAGRHGGVGAWIWTRRLALGFASAMLLANLLMVYALVTLDFSVGYVAQVGSHATPLHIRAISLWASLEGSILFWGGVLSLYVGGLTLSLGERHRRYMSWTLHVLLAVCIFFTLLIAGIASPFDPVFPVPMDGPGPNPLLQNHWLMAIHPPVLYLGYVGMSVPFAMICAGLLAGRMEAGWMVPVRRWMLIPWGFLSMGIVLGGWWSYEVLGWGGAWAWDPVENASFHPWLTGTAFLHSAMVLQRRNRLRDWTLILGISTFLLTLLGTFMTRSGVFNSVHSFTQSDIGPAFLAFIGVTLTYALVLIATRTHLLDEAAEAQDARLGAHRKPSGTWAERLLSREMAILLQNALFAAFTFLVLFGTLYPLITEALEGRQVSVGEPYFNRRAVPIGLALVFLMGVGPALPWGRMAPRLALRRFLVPLAGGAGFAALFAAFGFDSTMTVLAMFLIGFAATANLRELFEPTRERTRRKGESWVTALWRTYLRTRRRFGGHVAHYGVLLAVLSLTLSQGYKAQEDFHLNTGESATFGEYQLTFQGGAQPVDETYRVIWGAPFTVTSTTGGGTRTLSPKMNQYATDPPQTIYTPAVWSHPTHDLYLSLIEISVDGKSVVFRAMHHPYQIWLWVAGGVIFLGAMICVWPGRREETP